MVKTLITIAFFMGLTPGLAKQGKLLDKVSAVIDNHIITLSRVKRIEGTLKQIKLIAPIIYSKEKYSHKDILDTIIFGKMIKTGLKDIGFIINDDQVEESISNRQKMLGVSRENLVEQLRQFGFDFDEYFELIRASIEYNLFNQKIIRPLINITDQEIKNAYYSQSGDANSLSFKYNLVDFYIPKQSISAKNLKLMRADLKRFQSNGVLPEYLKDVQTQTFDDFMLDGMAQPIVKALQKAQVETFTRPVLMDGSYHVFYIKGKKSVESNVFAQKKRGIRAQLEQVAINKMRTLWFERESSRHYIKYF